MGEVVIRRQGAGWPRRTAAAALLAALVIGCTSSKPARVVEATPETEAASTASAAARTAPAATEIRSLDLREGAPEVYIDLEANGPLVWTSYRNADGRVIVELPNAVPADAVADLAPEEGLVSSLKVERAEEGSRPLTRLFIAARQDVEHSVTADGPKLRIQLMPTGEMAEEAESRIAFEPVAPAAPAAEPAAPAMEPAPGEEVRAESRAASGTPDEPSVAPAPAGATATRLDRVEVLESAGTSVVRIAGDGEFPYSTFILTEPTRFVIDLAGVINRSAPSTIQVPGGQVERVRVAQYKPLPKPVARVVFDLKSSVVPVIERTADALVVSFPASGDGTIESAGESQAALEPAGTSDLALRPSGPAAAVASAQPRREPAIEV
ncbi:MAG TPA: AMIN domain-containing protein, partial [Thermoanaerobaculia bacterium]|nr:AMIN domain-containing protein [Thermoanaerobaculia bacterium]